MPSTNGAKADEKPILDLKGVSWGDSKRIAIIQGKIRKAVEAQDEEAVVEHMEALQKIMPRFVRSIPRSWFVADAPADLDFTDPATYDHLQGQRFQDVLAALQDREVEVADNAKN